MRTARLGEELRSALARALEGVGALDLGTKDLADKLGCTQVLSSRLRKALTSGSGQSVLLNLPGLEPLQAVQAGLERCGADPGALRSLAESIAALSFFLRVEVGDRRSLETILAEAHPDGLDGFEHSRRQAAFRAFSEGQGLLADQLVDTTILLPSEESGRATALSVLSVRGMESLRAGARFGWGATQGTVQELEASRQVLPGLDFEPFSRHPQAKVGAVELDGGTSLWEVSFDSFGTASRVDLFFQATYPDAFPSGIPAVGEPRRIGLGPGLACRRMVAEVFVHPSLFGGHAPELRILSTIGTGPVMPMLPDFATAQRPATRPSERLGVGPGEWELEGEPLHTGMLRMVFEVAGLDPAEFHGHRYDVTFPYPWNQPTHCWFHPSDPLRG